MAADRFSTPMTRYRLTLLLALMSLSLCGFGSCTDRVADLCHGSARENDDAKYENAVLALKPWSSSLATGDAIAQAQAEARSVGRQPASLGMSEVASAADVAS